MVWKCAIRQVEELENRTKRAVLWVEVALKQAKIPRRRFPKSRCLEDLAKSHIQALGPDEAEAACRQLLDSWMKISLVKQRQPSPGGMDLHLDFRSHKQPAACEGNASVKDGK